MWGALSRSNKIRLLSTASVYLASLMITTSALQANAASTNSRLQNSSPVESSDETLRFAPGRLLVQPKAGVLDRDFVSALTRHGTKPRAA
jgi:hypothetical protein